MPEQRDPSTADAATARPADVADAPAVDADHIIGMSFDKASRADEVLLNLSHLAREGEIGLADAVVVRKTDDDKVHVRQTVDATPKQGALSGTLWGLLAGTIFGGPVVGIVGAGIGAASGGLLAKLIDVGLDDGWVRQVGEWLDPGTSAVLVLVSDQVRPVVLRELSRFEGQVLYCTFPDTVRRELERALGQARDPSTTPGDPSLAAGGLPADDAPANDPPA
ncbi:hypothetical protein BH23ACT2_BH23ACT2_10480 [soil metagenome]